MTRKNIKITAGGAGALALALALTACGSTGGSKGGAHSGSGSAAGPVVVQAGQGARLSGAATGLQLWGWVPSNDQYPSDISEIPGGAYNTDNTVKVNNAHDLATESCTDVLSTVGGPGYGEESYMIDQGSNANQTLFFTYGASVYPTAADARAYVEELAARFTGCGSFTVSANGTSFPADLSAGPRSEAAGVLDADTAVDLRETASSNGHQEIGDLLVAVDGNTVVYETESSESGSLPNVVSLPKLADELLSAITQGEAAQGAGAGSGSSPGARIGGGR